MKNSYEFLDDQTVKIHLQNGLFTLIDAADLPIADSINGTWFAKKERNGLYVRTWVRDKNEERRWCKFHRHLLSETNPRVVIDHVNRNTLDNRRSVNLRRGTQAQNSQNIGMQKNNTSGYRGVTYIKKVRKWKAQVMLNRKCHYLGHYDTAEEAAKVAAEFRAKYMPFTVEKEVI